jgi:hypothetical protein
MLENHEKKLHINLEMLTKLFHEKKMLYVKRQNSVLKRHCMRHFFIFFTQDTNMLGFCKTWRAHIEC